MINLGFWQPYELTWSALQVVAKDVGGQQLSMRPDDLVALHRIRTYQEDGFAVYNDFSPTQRRDRLWQAQLSWLWQFGPDWLLMASIDAERRFSSFEFFDTHRYQTQLGLRYLF